MRVDQTEPAIGGADQFDRLLESFILGLGINFEKDLQGLPIPNLLDALEVGPPGEHARGASAACRPVECTAVDAAPSNPGLVSGPSEGRAVDLLPAAHPTGGGASGREEIGRGSGEPVEGGSEALGNGWGVGHTVLRAVDRERRTEIVFPTEGENVPEADEGVLAHEEDRVVLGGKVGEQAGFLGVREEAAERGLLGGACEGVGGEGGDLEVPEFHSLREEPFEDVEFVAEGSTGDARGGTRLTPCLEVRRGDRVEGFWGPRRSQFGDVVGVGVVCEGACGEGTERRGGGCGLWGAGGEAYAHAGVVSNGAAVDFNGILLALAFLDGGAAGVGDTSRPAKRALAVAFDEHPPLR